MSKLRITGRNDIPMQNIPLRSDLGAKIRAALRDQRPRVFQNADFSSLEMQIHGHYVNTKKEDDRG